MMLRCVALLYIRSLLNKKYFSVFVPLYQKNIKMIRPLRKRHLQSWTAFAVLIPVGIISAVIVRPQLPKDKLLQPATTAPLPVVLKSVTKNDYTISVRSNIDTSLVQLEWINKKTLIY